MPDTRKAHRPLIWILTGVRLGDNLQSLALAKALDWPQKTITLEYNSAYRIPNSLLGHTLVSLKPASAAQIRPPWPDLVIACGRRSVPVARWIKRKSGGHTKLVQLGRPRAALDAFDLVVTTPQYALPDLDNIVQNLLPLSSPPQANDKTDHKTWQKRFEHLPSPWTGVLVGGNTWPFILNHNAAIDLGQRANNIAGHNNGSLLLTSGPRTPPEAFEALRSVVSTPAYFYKFADTNENPYSTILALCDDFIVTGDSVSMIGEACKTGKPVYIFDLPRNRSMATVMAGGINNIRYRQGLLGGALRYLAKTGIFSPPRNVARFHEAIIDARLAAWLGRTNRNPTPIPDELGTTKQHVKALFESEQ